MKLSLRLKVVIPVICCVFLGVVIMVLVTGYSAAKVVNEEIEKTAMTKLRDAVLIALTTMMEDGGDFKKSKSSFVNQISHSADLRVLRSSHLDKDFGRGGNDEYAKDNYEQEVLDKGVARVVKEGDTLKGIYPYIAKKDFLGRNCLNCHNVPEGTVLGAIAIVIPLKDSRARIREIQYSFGFMGLAGIAALAILVYIWVKNILKPLELLTKDVGEITNGNLSINFNHGSHDEIGVLSSSMNNMIAMFKNLLGRLSDSSASIVKVVENLQTESRKMAMGSENQSGQIMQIATANEEMSATAGEIAANCHMVEQNSQQATVIAQEGAEVVQKTIFMMNSIADRVKTSAHTVESLGSRSDQIGAIVGTIEDIADQTNLLALNAAIEAARAGEQGRGFAVVADEVRALAEKTTKATREIGAMIKSIQGETQNAITLMEESVSEVNNGTREASRSGEALERILNQIHSVTMQISQIATAAEEQTATVHEINNNIQRVADVTKDNQAVEKNVLQEVDQLTVTARELIESTSGFNV